VFHAPVVIEVQADDLQQGGIAAVWRENSTVIRTGRTAEGIQMIR
jgi:hypothetical protein